MSGRIEVKGEIYQNEMPGHAFLSDNEVADLLSFLRQAFGNRADPITVSEVARQRERTTSAAE
jgi:hypothetical protein